MATDRRGKKLIIYYDDGIKVTRRDITVSDEDETFIYDTTGHYYNKTYIRRMEDV